MDQQKNSNPAHEASADDTKQKMSSFPSLTPSSPNSKPARSSSVAALFGPSSSKRIKASPMFGHVGFAQYSSKSKVSSLPAPSFASESFKTPRPSPIELSDSEENSISDPSVKINAAVGIEKEEDHVNAIEEATFVIEPAAVSNADTESAFTEDAAVGGNTTDTKDNSDSQCGVALGDDHAASVPQEYPLAGDNTVKALGERSAKDSTQHLPAVYKDAVDQHKMVGGGENTAVVSQDLADTQVPPSSADEELMMLRAQLSYTLARLDAFRLMCHSFKRGGKATGISFAEDAHLYP